MANEYVRVAPSGGAKLVDINPNKQNDYMYSGLQAVTGVTSRFSIPVVGYKKIAIYCNVPVTFYFKDSSGSDISSISCSNNWTYYDIPSNAIVCYGEATNAATSNGTIARYSLLT